MGKGSVGIVAGYWPDDVYRYMAIPSIYLDEALVTRPAKRFPEKTAVQFDSSKLTYQQLAAETDKAARAILSLTEGKNLRVTFLLTSPLEFLPVFIGALRAHCMVQLPDLSAAPEGLLPQISAFSPDLVIMGDKMDKKITTDGQKTRTLSLAELYQLKPGTSRVLKRLDMKGPSVALAGREGKVFYQSHQSVLAGAISWSAFIPLDEKDVVLNLQPFYTWEGLYGLLPVLFKGATCHMASLEDPEKLACSLVSQNCSYTWLTQEEARKFLREPQHNLINKLKTTLSGLFVSVSGSFRPRSRKLLKNLFGGVPVLTVFGLPEAGPVVASHPTWYLNEAIGIPVSNVDLWPLNPQTGNPLLVPWEAIESAEIGIKSPMTAVAFSSPEEKGVQVREDWLRSYLIASMDPNGLFYPRQEFSPKTPAAISAC